MRTAFTHEEAAALIGEPASKVRTWIARGYVVPKTPAQWTATEMLALGIYNELLHENLSNPEAAGLALAILELIVTGKPAGGKATDVIVVSATFESNAWTRCTYSRQDADRLVDIAMRHKPARLIVRDFGHLCQRVRQALADGVVDVAGIAAMGDQEGAGHA